jgi:phage terminase small subunit
LRASYLAAGYACSPASATTAGGRLLDDPRVRRRVAELQRDLHRRSDPSPAARGDPMAPLTNRRHEAFAQAFVRGPTAGNRRESYWAAGYEKNAKSAREGSWRLMKKPTVVRRIAELRQELQAQEARAAERAIDRLAITKEAVLAELAKIAFANMLDYVRVGEDGRVAVDFARIDRDKGAAIQEVVVTPERACAGSGKDRKGEGAKGEGGEGGAVAAAQPRIRIRLASKRDALVDLGRHFGLFVARPQAEDEFAGLSEDELAARVRDVVVQLERIGIDVPALIGLREGAYGDPAAAHAD